MQTRKQMAYFVIFVAVGYVIFVRRSLYHYFIRPSCSRTEHFQTTFTHAQTNHSEKLILFYTSFFGKKPWIFAWEFSNYTESCGCNFSGCKITYDQNMYPVSDVVIFHGRNMPCLKTLVELHRQRKHGQLWAYFNLENPLLTPSVKPLDDFFNLSISYKLKSEIQMPYRYHRCISYKKVGNTTKINYAIGKTKLVAWMVSNCNRLRDDLVRKLALYGIHVAVGGICKKHFRNRLNCFSGNCTEELNKYKFYFAAENNLCKDYITEKYWENSLRRNLVPIVLGGANYSNPDLAIPGSYIDAMRFNNVRELAAYILKLNSDDKKYNEYFRWKEHWEILKFHRGCNYFVCNLCQKIQQKAMPTKSNSLSSVFQPSDCYGNEMFFKKWLQR